ncbi:MAG TPA: hypothetical protein VMG09_11990 [Bacteroidota bacterium]|nr:hypothetical protein [Bacteroidota bacterium]
MFEHRTDQLLSRREFAVRQFRHVVFAGLLIMGGWAIGITGYMGFEQMSFVDALLNAAMILGGMGPVTELRTVGGKVFASFYAVFSGVGFIGATGVLFAPVYHRFIHKFHLETEESRRPKPRQSISNEE